jgi:hypothetical protein
VRGLIRIVKKAHERKFLKNQVQAQAEQQNIDNIHKGKAENVIRFEKITLFGPESLCAEHQMKRKAKTE